MKALWRNSSLGLTKAVFIALSLSRAFAAENIPNEEIEEYLSSFGADSAIIEVTRDSDVERKKSIAHHAQTLIESRMAQMDNLSTDNREETRRLIKEIELLSNVLTATENETLILSISEKLLESGDSRFTDNALSLAQSSKSDEGYNLIFQYGQHVISSLPDDLDQNAVPNGGEMLSDLIHCLEKLLITQSPSSRHLASQLMEDFKERHSSSSKGRAIMSMLDSLHKKMVTDDSLIKNEPLNVNDEDSIGATKPLAENGDRQNFEDQKMTGSQNSSIWIFVIVGIILLAVIAVIGFKVLGNSS